jgi:hypothetical protein
MRIRVPLVASFAVVAVACGPTARSFSPTEHVESTTIEGHQEASYELGDKEDPRATVKVWSRGAEPVGADSTVIHVGFTVENSGSEPLTFQPGETRLDAIKTDRGATISNVPPTDRGAVTVPPESSEDIELAFALPRGFTPEDVRGFRVQWSTTSPDGERHVEFTPFARDPDYDYYAPYYDFYGPYYGYYPYHWSYWGPYWGPYSHSSVVVHAPRPTVVDHR